MKTKWQGPTINEGPVRKGGNGGDPRTPPPPFAPKPRPTK
jgi:hypothetical protein